MVVIMLILFSVKYKTVKNVLIDLTNIYGCYIGCIYVGKYLIQTELIPNIIYCLDY